MPKGAPVHTCRFLLRRWPGGKHRSRSPTSPGSNLFQLAAPEYGFSLVVHLGDEIADGVETEHECPHHFDVERTHCLSPFQVAINDYGHARRQKGHRDGLEMDSFLEFIKSSNCLQNQCNDRNFRGYWRQRD